MSIPNHILERIRQRYDLDENDSSLDAEIEKLSPIEKLREAVAWELGDPDWANQVLEWAKAVGIKVSI